MVAAIDLNEIRSTDSIRDVYALENEPSSDDKAIQTAQAISKDFSRYRKVRFHATHQEATGEVDEEAIEQRFQHHVFQALFGLPSEVQQAAFDRLSQTHPAAAAAAEPIFDLYAIAQSYDLPRTGAGLT